MAVQFPTDRHVDRCMGSTSFRRERGGQGLQGRLEGEVSRRKGRVWRGGVKE